MNIESKFALNQEVFPISRARKRKTEKCPQCNGVGKMSWFDGTAVNCGRCWGNKSITISSGESWQVGELLTVGEINISIRSFKKTNICLDISGHFSNLGVYDPDKMTKKETVMCYETGIGSGALHNVDKLFATLGAANNECAKLNKKEESV